MKDLHLIVGLGNPGAEYARTRHNAGFLLVESLAQRWRAGWVYEKKFNARVARPESAAVRVLLCEPQTYMNSSGEAVGSLVAFYRVPLARLLVVVDDADLPLGEIRLRAGGSSGGVRSAVVKQERCRKQNRGEDTRGNCELFRSCY